MMPPTNGKKPKSLSLVIPVYNEERQLLQFLKAIDQVKFRLKKELIFVNDGSSDASANIIRTYRFKSATIFIDEKVNRGKGAAIHKGIAAARGDIIGIQDADFEYDMTDINKILNFFVRDNCDVVFGSRFYERRLRIQLTLHFLANRVLTTLSNIFSGISVSDMETCYKFFRRDIIQNINLTSQRFGFEPEVTAKIARLNIRTKEVPVSYSPRNHREGKKITWKDGFAAVWHLLYFNFIARERFFFKPAMPTPYLTEKKKF